MPRSLFLVTRTTRRKLTSALVAMAIFTCLGALTTAAVGRPVEIGTTNAALIGLGVGLFEEFYVQSRRGDWLRAMHPLRSIPVYVAVVIVLYFISVHIAHVVLGRLDDLPTAYRRLPYGLTFFTIFSMVGILMIRVVHFIGLGTLFHLMVGTYHRPVGERKVLLFLDINGSTELGEKLGALKMRSLVRKFLSDVTQPIIRSSWRDLSLQGRWADRDVGLDGGHRGRRNPARSGCDACPCCGRARHLSPIVRRRAGFPHRHPRRGAVIVSEQGDTKRSIGIYGYTINIAARMEEAARAHNAACVISCVIADALTDRSRFDEIGQESVKGISAPIQIFKLRTGTCSRA
jgi:adenylate cyclase